MEEMGMHKAGFMRLGNAEKRGMHRETPDANVVTAQEYMAKGCQVFLAQISAKKKEDKSEGKQIKDVPIVQVFPEVFHEIAGLIWLRPVDIPNHLIPGRTRFSSSTVYRLAPSEIEGIIRTITRAFSDKWIHQA
ncbi:hypothetical protein Tco_0599711 [Tanacetum coccineum]